MLEDLVDEFWKIEKRRVALAAEQGIVWARMVSLKGLWGAKRYRRLSAQIVELDHQKDRLRHEITALRHKREIREMARVRLEMERDWSPTR